MSDNLQQNNEQQENVHYSVSPWGGDKLLDRKLRRKPNPISLWRNEYWEKINTEKYSEFSYASFLEAMDDVKYERIENHPVIFSN